MQGSEGSSGTAGRAESGAGGGLAGATLGGAASSGSAGAAAGGADSSGSGGGGAGGVSLSAGNGGESARAGSAGGGGAAGSSGSAGGAGTSGAAGSGGGNGLAWTGTWSAAPQLTEEANLPPAPGLSNRTLRQIFYGSIGGSRLRVHFSNAFGQTAVTLNAVRIALAKNAGSIDVATDRALAFSGMPAVTIPPGGTATSDAMDFALPAQTSIALSIAFGNTPAEVTGHPGSRATSYIAAGNAAGAATLTAPVSAEHWYYVTGIDVLREHGEVAAVMLGDSLTDGRGSTTDGNNRWPDDLSRRLRQNAPTTGVAVLNQALGGNAVLSGGNGPPALTRFERDVLGQAGARWLIVLAGVNDIGVAASAAVAQDLIDAYQTMLSAARAAGVRSYGMPILPFGGSMYDSPAHETARQTVNTWIRAAGHFDAVIDLETVVRDPSHVTRLLPAYDQGDHLHLNGVGYQAMADAIDLSLLTP